MVVRAGQLVASDRHPQRPIGLAGKTQPVPKSPSISLRFSSNVTTSVRLSIILPRDMQFNKKRGRFRVEPLMLFITPLAE